MMTSAKTPYWRVVLDSAEPLALATAGAALGWGASQGATTIDHEPTSLPLPEAFAIAKTTVDVKQKLARTSVAVRAMFGWQPDVAFTNWQVPLDIEEVVRNLSELPFGAAIFSAFVPWPGDYNGFHWPGGLGPIGWAVAFKGPGHDRFPSRNWFERGPWKRWRGPNDVTLIQFHALDATPEQALAQAMPGHVAFGVNAEAGGGYMQKGYVYTHELKGVYFKDTGTVRVIIHGRDISNGEMRDWAAARLEGKYKHVAFVFMLPDEARAHLPRLWRYGHEVWAMFDGEERRIDEGYEPPDETPEWAKS